MAEAGLRCISHGVGRVPIYLDRPAVLRAMAMTVVARGKARRAMQRNEPIPSGWALDQDGRATTDARAGYEGVVLPPVRVKGSGPSPMMAILAGVMSGANVAGEILLPGGPEMRIAAERHERGIPPERLEPAELLAGA